MKNLSPKILFTFSSIPILTSAWPVLNLHRERRLDERTPVSYSVVAVDGGSTAQGPPTATVTDAVTQTRTLITTKLSTTILTESETPTTVVITITATSATTIVQSAEPTTTPTPQTSSPPPSWSSTPTVTVSEVSTITTSPTPSLTTIYVSPELSSSAYDDGMWHTTYYKQATVSESTWSTTPASFITVPPVEPIPTSSAEVEAELEASNLRNSFSSWPGAHGGSRK